MNHIKAISIKFIIVAIVLFSILGAFYTTSLTSILIMSLLVTGIAYVIGDLFILPRYGNLVATIADFGLAFLSVWFLGELFIILEYGLVAASLFVAALLSCAEAVFHAYMQEKVLDSTEEVYIDRTNTRHFQTEFGEDNPDPDYLGKHKDKGDSNHRN